MNRERGAPAREAQEEVEIPPVTLEVAKANAGQYGATPQIAETWWLTRDASNWLDSRGQQITRWQSDLRAYAIRWRENDNKRPATNGHGHGAKPMPAAGDRIPGFDF